MLVRAGGGDARKSLRDGSVLPTLPAPRGSPAFNYPQVRKTLLRQELWRTIWAAGHGFGVVISRVSQRISTPRSDRPDLWVIERRWRDDGRHPFLVAARTSP